VLPAEPGAAELKGAFTPSAAEIRFVPGNPGRKPPLY
jgi:hypothetical protein